MTKLERLWKDKWKIVKALLNTLFKTSRIEKIAKDRERICRSNKCGFYDKNGTSEKTFIKGKPSCGVCGCNIKILTHSPESTCSLKELNKEPLWKETN